MTKEIAELSTDIHVITAEINAYQRVAGEAIFEIGRRLHEVKYNPIKYGLPSGTDKEGRTIVARGAWGEWLVSLGIPVNQANRFTLVYRELSECKSSTLTNNGLSALYEIATMPEEQREVEHKVPSTGEVKKVEEMTVRELREVKAELKRKNDEIAEAKRSEHSVRVKLEAVEKELASKPKEVVIEKERIVEIDKTDYKVTERLKAYEEKFGAIENYSDRVRATNVDDVTTSIISFNMTVRDFIKRHAYLLRYQDTIKFVDKITQREYNEAVQALKEVSADFCKVSGVGDYMDVEFSEVQ